MGPLFVLIAAAAPASTPAPPMPWLKAEVERARQLADRKVQAGTPGEATWRADVKREVDGLLDWDDLTKASLGKHWQELQPREQREIASLLRQMIEASYRSKLQMAARGEVKKPKKVTVEWIDHAEQGERATAHAKVKSDESVASLELKLHFVDKRWRVSDVSIDDVSTVRTYRTQFGKIIGKEGVSGLIARMKKKVEDIKAGRTELGP